MLENILFFLIVGLSIFYVVFKIFSPKRMRVQGPGRIFGDMLCKKTRLFR